MGLSCSSHVPWKVREEWRSSRHGIREGGLSESFVEIIMPYPIKKYCACACTCIFTAAVGLYQGESTSCIGFQL